MKKQYGGGIVRVGAVAALLCMPGALWAASDPGEVIKYRQNVMKTIGGNAAAAGAILQNKVEFRDRLGEHARALEAATRNIPALFPPGSDTGAETRALEAIWKNRAEFERLAKDVQEKAAVFARAVAANDDGQTRARFKELADSCKGCHKDFRKEQK